VNEADVIAAGGIATPPYMAEPPVVGPFPALVMPTPSIFRLSNGVQVVAVRRQAAPIVALNLVLRTGADHDPEGQAGLGSLTAEMMDERRRWRAWAPTCGWAPGATAPR
jgi:hypothetical protein